MEQVIKNDLFRETIYLYKKTGKNAEGDPIYAEPYTFKGYSTKTFQWIHNERGERQLSSARIYVDGALLSRFTPGDAISFDRNTRKQKILNIVPYNKPEGDIDFMVVYVL